MPTRVFVSYRREDSSAAAGRIYDRLVKAFPRNAIFMDIDAIDAGAEFPSVIDQTLARSKVVLVVIGPRWAGGSTNARRIDDPNDFVRLEVAAALVKPGLKVVPVLLDGAEMPSSADLPEPLQPLARRNAVSIRHERFDDDVDALIRSIGGRVRRGGGALGWLGFLASLLVAGAAAAFLLMVGQNNGGGDRTSPPPPPTETVRLSPDLRDAGRVGGAGDPVSGGLLSNSNQTSATIGFGDAGRRVEQRAFLSFSLDALDRRLLQSASLKLAIGGRSGDLNPRFLSQVVVEAVDIGGRLDGSDFNLPGLQLATIPFSELDREAIDVSAGVRAALRAGNPRVTFRLRFSIGGDNDDEADSLALSVTRGRTYLEAVSRLPE